MAEDSMAMNEHEFAAENEVIPLRMPVALQRFLQVLIIISVPFVLVLGSVRLAMSEAMLRFEYERSGFPEDPFGFTTEDRLQYGPYGIRYLLNNEDINYLANLEINGQPAFDERELGHMEDVKAVTQTAIQVLMLTGSAFVFGVILLIRKPPTRPALFQALRYGAVLTFVSIAGLIVVVVVSWDTFFDNFHGAFFEAGTWQFSKSDTLIRLYPEQFWFDISLFIGGLTLLGALLLIASPWLYLKVMGSSPALELNGLIPDA